MLHFQYCSLQGFFSTSVVKGIFPSPRSSVSVSWQLQCTHIVVGTMNASHSVSHMLSHLLASVIPEAVGHKLGGHVQTFLIN